MKKSRLFFTIGLVVVGLPLAAYQWPATGGDVSAPFGGRSALGLQKKMTITGFNNLLVQPALTGEIIFEQDEEQVVMASKSGQLIVLQNEEDMRTIYSNLEQKTYEGYQVANQQAIAIPSVLSNTMRQFDLAFYDNKKRQFVNPRLFIATNSSPRLPIINSIFIRDASGIVRPINNDSQVRAGRVEVLVSATEYSPAGGYALWPYAVSLEFMGETVSKAQFDAISSQQGVAYLVGASRLPLDELYSDEGYLRLGRINLIPGQGYLTIKTFDINGREIQRILRLAVS